MASRIKLNLSAQFPYKDSRDQEGSIETTTHPTVKLASHRTSGLVDTHEPGTSSNACKSANLTEESVFLGGNFTGERKESTAGMEKGVPRELDRFAKGNRILAG